MGSSRDSGHKSSKHKKSKSRKSSSSRSHRKSEKRRSKDGKHRSKRKWKYSTSSSSDSGSDSDISKSNPTQSAKRIRHPHAEDPEDSADDEVQDTTGPALPPHLRKKRRQEKEAQTHTHGPVQPETGTEESSRQSRGSYEEGNRGEAYTEVSIGPSLPSVGASTEHAQKHVHRPVCGPAMPPQGVHLSGNFATVQPEVSDDDDFVGPAVPISGVKVSQDTIEDKVRMIEERMRKTKDQITNKDNEASDAPAREAWMMELPPEHSLSMASNLTARSFATKTPSGGDRSGWTDTPQAIAERRQKAMERIQNGTQGNVDARPEGSTVRRPPGSTAREREMASMVDAYNASSRAKSLMEMHGEKSQQAVAELQETKMRGGKGFDRDRDMNLRQVDDKKFRELTSAPGKGLNSMFGSGESRFL